MPREFVVARRDADERRAGAGSNDPPARRAARRRAPARRTRSRAAPHPIPEPTRRPRVGLGASGRTCRIARSDAGPQAGRRTSKGDIQREHSRAIRAGAARAASRHDGSPNTLAPRRSDRGIDPRQRGRPGRVPDPGVLLDVRRAAGHGRRSRVLVQSNTTVLRCSSRNNFLVILIIAQFALVIGISVRHPAAQRDRRARPVLRLRGEPRHHRSVAIVCGLHTASRSRPRSCRRRPCSAARRCTATRPSARSRASAASPDDGA